MSAILTLGAAVLAASGCDGVFWEACTLIGCSDGITVEVTGARSPSLRMEAVANDGYSLVHDCDVVDGRCTIGFERFTPDAFSLTITGTDDYVALDLQPVYEVLQPNGPNCDPSCRVAQVRVALSPAS